MIHFIHKEKMPAGQNSDRLTVYYTYSQIVMGFVLVALVGFFIRNYVQVNLYQMSAPNAPIKLTIIK